MSQRVTYVVSDTHFGHKGVCKFLRNDGVTKLRPWDDADVMTNEMIELWNQEVKPIDKVYHLGDVVINRKYLEVLQKLNGEKILIKGNHDIFKLSDYLPHFRDIRSCHVLNGVIFTHIPIHVENLGRFGSNVHGHTHANHMTLNGERDARFYNVCVENTDYKPIRLDQVFEDIKKAGGSVGFKPRTEVFDMNGQQ